MADDGREDPRRNASAEQASGRRPGLSDISTRALSGAGLAAFTLVVLWAGPLPYAALVLAVGLVASFEWARIVRGPQQPDRALAIHGLTLAGSLLLSALGYIGLAVAIALAGALIVLVIELGQRSLVSAAGVLYTGLPSIALLWIRGDEQAGFTAALLIMAVVAATDTGAFVAGRLLGGPRLAPRISPNKTWSGFVGGALAGVATAAVFSHVVSLAPYWLAVIGLTLSLMAQIGDLAESALKRAFGVKDAGSLIPGHGGVLDRVDGIVAAALAAGALALLINPQAPSRALLHGF